ncbi:MAG: aldo/keto reductase [Rhodospirillales bacterium]|nr:aldo/keto reductase [Rhodospirillales bacterium]
MERRRLGGSGIDVSAICLGTLMFGHQSTDAEGRRMLDLARERGVNFLDTANTYGLGQSEDALGRLMSPGERQKWIIASKTGMIWNDKPNRSGMSRKWILESIDATLRRLRTDYVDVYYIHRDEPEVPLEEPMRAMADIVRQGKARYIGLSNFAGWRIAEAVAACDRLGVPRPTVCQPYYNAANRMAEVEIFPACVHYQMGIVPYSPLSRGVLTGQYGRRTTVTPHLKARAKYSQVIRSDFRPESLALAETIGKHAAGRGQSTIHMAVNWVLNNRLVTSVLAGPRTAAQLKDYLDAVDKPFTAAEETLIDGLVPAGAPSSHNWIDPVLPATGRGV